MTNRRALLMAGIALSALALTTKFGEAETMTASGTVDYRNLSDMDWRQRLTADQYTILRQHGTERAGSSPLNKEKRKGTFACAGCDLPLFSSETNGKSHPAQAKVPLRFSLLSGLLPARSVPC